MLTLNYFFQTTHSSPDVLMHLLVFNWVFKKVDTTSELALEWIFTGRGGWVGSTSLQGRVEGECVMGPGTELSGLSEDPGRRGQQG